MPTQPRIYRRMPGRGLRRAGPIALTRTSATLWAGPDHLLCLDSTGYTEEYRRFYYNDIQSLIVRKTNRGRNWNLILGGLALIPALIALWVSGVGAALLWSAAGLFAVCLLINRARGATCVCHLSTAVHQEELASLDRLRVANKVIAQLRPLIDNAQGALPEEALSRLVEVTPAAAPAQGHLMPGRSGTRTAQAPASGGTRVFHRVLFTLLILNGIATLIDMFVTHVAATLAASLVGAMVAASTIAALVRQQSSGVSRTVKALTWITLGYVVLLFLVSYAFFITMSIQQPGVVRDQWQYLQYISQMSPFDSPFSLALSIFGIVTALSLGLVGNILLGRSDVEGAPADVPSAQSLPAAESADAKPS